MAALVQVKAGKTTGSSLTITLSSSTTAGNCLAVAVLFGGDTTTADHVSTVKIGGVADNFAQLIGLNPGGSAFADTELWADPNCVGGQTSVAITGAGGTGNRGLAAWVYEFSGIVAASPLDKSSGHTSTSGTAFTSNATATTTYPSEVWVGIGGTCQNSALTSPTGPASPWVNQAGQVQAIASSDVAAVSGYQITTSTGTATYSGTISHTGESVAVVATIQAVSGTPRLIVPGPWPVRRAAFY